VKILFISTYSEVLKTFVPLINYFKNKNNQITVIARYIPKTSDYEKNKKLFEKNELFGDLIINENLKEIKSPKFLFNFFHNLRIKKIVHFYYNKYKPDIIILGPDKNNFERLIIKKSKKNNIPSICFQWSLGPITKKSFYETKKRLIFDELKQLAPSNSRKIFKLIIKIPSFIINTLFGLRTPIIAPCYGGGDATALAVIGKTSKDFFSNMGIDKKKIYITGHPLIEKTFYNKEKISKTLPEIISFNESSNYLLYCTSKYLLTKKDYLHGRSIFKLREEKIRAILSTSYKGNIILKLHPSENINNYISLEKISKRVRVLDEIDIIELIKFCDIFLTRYSTSAYYAMLYEKPIITHNCPKIPFGSYFSELKGTIYVDNHNDLINNIELIVKKDTKLLNFMKRERNQFIEQHLNINLNNNKQFLLPSINNFENLIKKLYIK